MGPFVREQEIRDLWAGMVLGGPGQALTCPVRTPRFGASGRSSSLSLKVTSQNNLSPGSSFRC